MLRASKAESFGNHYYKPMRFGVLHSSGNAEFAEFKTRFCRKGKLHTQEPGIGKRFTLARKGFL